MVMRLRIATARRFLRIGFIALPVLALGCKPDLEGRPSLIDSARVLSIRSTAAEVNEGTNVTYDALIAQPVGDTSVPDIDWALCLAQKPIATSGPIAAECLKASSPKLANLGGTLSATAMIPKDACQLFGPITPPHRTGEPELRAADPDTTGGYYQPVRLRTAYSPEDAEYEVGVTRLMCGMGSGASQAQTLTYNKGYRPNENPGFEQLKFTRASGEVIVVDSTTTQSVSSGEVLTFEVSWPSCPVTSTCGDGICGAGEDVTSCPNDCTTPKGCEGSEPYLMYDPASQTLQERRESMRVAWYATDGSFNHDRTGRTEAEADQSSTSNTWTAPSHSGLVRFWLVIRDDRRGENFTTFDLNVE
jgi:hypothetical protein